MNKCPGQDKRFWKPEDIFDVQCETCGESIEFFKDDPKRRCPKCGTLVINPKVLSGCARWCAFAKECLGFDPNENSADEPVCDTLIRAMKRIFGSDQKRITHALKVLNYAESILRAEKDASPVVVKAAAVLHDIGIKEAERKYGSAAPAGQQAEGPPIAWKIMEDCGLDQAVIEHVCRIIADHHTAREMDTPEFRIVWDADRLVNFDEEHPDTRMEQRERIIEKVFRTSAGKELARRLLLNDGKKT